MCFALPEKIFGCKIVSAIKSGPGKHPQGWLSVDVPCPPVPGGFPAPKSSSSPSDHPIGGLRVLQQFRVDLEIFGSCLSEKEEPFPCLSVCLSVCPCRPRCGIRDLGCGIWDLGCGIEGLEFRI